MMRANVIVLSEPLADDCLSLAGCCKPFGVQRHCQTNLNGPAKVAGLRRSGGQLTPLSQGGRTVLFEDIAAVEVAVVVEVVVD